MSSKVTLPDAATLHLESGFDLGWLPDSSNAMTDLKGWYGSSPVRRNKSDRIGAHGTFGERGWKDERLVIVSGAYVAASRGEAARMVETLSGYLGDGTEGRLEVLDSDLGLRWANVYLAGDGITPSWNGQNKFTYTVHLLATDPRKYGSVASSGLIGIPVSGGALVTEPLFGNPNAGILDFGTAGYSGTTTLNNPGTADTGPVFTITGTSVPGFTITEIGSQRKLVYTDTVLAGQTLVLDTNDGSVTLDGYAPRNQYLTVPQWTRLKGGASGTWLFESPGSTNANMKVEVTPAWW